MADLTQPAGSIFTPAATVEDIQHRLLRPPSLQSSQILQSYDSGRPLEENGPELQRNEEGGSTKRKLVDYLDPVLLAAVSARISGAKKKTAMKMNLVRAGNEFKWPVDKLKVFAEMSGKNRVDQRSGEAVEVNDESKTSCDAGAGGRSTRTALEWVEQTTLKR